MILLTTPPPTTTDDFTASLRTLLAQAITLKPDTVTADGVFPALNKLSLNLTDCLPLDHPTIRWSDGATGGAVGQFTVTDFQLRGQPFGDATRPIEIDASARLCRGEFIPADNGKTALRIAAATDGQLRVSVTKAAVEAIALAEANKAAAAQGVQVKEVQVTWQSQGPRSLSLEIQVKAKKGFFPTAAVRVRGRLDVDGSLVARLSALSVEGEGMVGNLAAGLIRPKLLQAEGMNKSLLALPLDALKVTGVTLVASPDRLTVEGQFEG